MIVVERMVQEIAADKWAELEELNNKYTVLEGRLGFPPKKRLQIISGAHTSATINVERQWPSLAEMEAAYEKAFADPDYIALFAAGNGIVLSNQVDLFAPMP